MVGTIDYAVLVRMLRGAASRVRDSEAELSRLDSFGGDGDHGTTMVRAMAQLDAAIDAAADDDPAALLKAVGWAIMGVDGGATGPLFGSLFMAMAEAVPAGGKIDAAALAGMLEAGLVGVRKNTRAEVGDKTVIDALVPAIAAASAAAREGVDTGRVLEAAAAAAEAGAASTTGLAARFGRAKNVGDRSKGAQDPGATSVSLIFRGLLDGVRTDG